MFKRFLVGLLVICMTLGVVGTSFGGFNELTENQKSRLSMEVQVFNECMLEGLVEYPDKQAPAAEIVFFTAGNYCDAEGNGIVDVLRDDFEWSDDEIQEFVGVAINYWVDLVWQAQNN